MVFEMPQKVLFKHCDPAGIVFFPRFFEMMNDCVEMFFDQALGLPFERLLKTGGVPTAQISTHFSSPSRHGDLLLLRLGVLRVGRSAVDYRLTAHCGPELRFETRATLVYVDASGRPAPWPEETRLKLVDYRDDAP